jgi:hypothetical protein
MQLDDGIWIGIVAADRGSVREISLGAGLVAPAGDSAEDHFVGQGIEVVVQQLGQTIAEVTARFVVRPGEDCDASDFADWVTAIEEGFSAAGISVVRVPASSLRTAAVTAAAPPRGASPGQRQAASVQRSRPPERVPRPDQERVDPGVSIVLGLLLAIVGGSATISAVALAFGWLPPLWMVQWGVALLIGAPHEGIASVILGLTALLALLGVGYLINGQRAGQVFAVLAGSLYLGTLAAAVGHVAIRDEVGTQVFELLGPRPLGEFTPGIWPGTIIVGAAAMVAVVLAIATAPSPVTSPGSTWTTATLSVLSIATIAAAVGVGFGSGWVSWWPVDGAREYAAGTSSPVSRSSASTGSGSYPTSGSGASAFRTTTTIRAVTTTTIPSRLAGFANAYSCAGLPSPAPVDHFQAGSVRVTICQSGGSLYWVEQSSSAPRPFVVQRTGTTYAGTGTDGVRTVSPDTLTRPSATGANILSVTASSLSSSTTEVDVLVRLAELMVTSASGRDLVRDLSARLTSSCSISGAAATERIEAINENRRQLLVAAQNLQRAVPGSAAPVDEFVEAMRHSLDADLAWEDWIDRHWIPYEARSCAGTLAREGDPSFDAFVRSSDLATAAKAELVAVYNPLATVRGLRNDWRAADV